MSDEVIFESVKIDKYVLKTEKSPKIIIFDNDLQKNIVSVNTLNNENNMLLAEMILAELNTGKYEPVEDDVEPIDDTSSSPSDSSPIEQNDDGDVGNGDDNTQTGEDLDNEVQG